MYCICAILCTSCVPHMSHLTHQLCTAYAPSYAPAVYRICAILCTSCVPRMRHLMYQLCTAEPLTACSSAGVGSQLKGPSACAAHLQVGDAGRQANRQAGVGVKWQR